MVHRPASACLRQCLPFQGVRPDTARNTAIFARVVVGLGRTNRSYSNFRARASNQFCAVFDARPHA